MPGSVHADLLRAGVIPDFRQDMNSLAAEWVGARQWVYRRRFRAEWPSGGRRWLRLGGVDWAASVYLDGELLGRVKGAHTAVRLPLPDLEPDTEHLLVIVLDVPPAESGQLGRTSQTRSLKARYGYWWDFCTRLVQVGVVGAVSLEWDAGAALLDAAPVITLSPDLRRARIGVDAQHDGADDLILTATLTHPGGRSESQRGPASALGFDLTDVQLWWPRQLGGQPLYTLSVCLESGPAVSRRFGLRDVQLVHNAVSAAREALPYTLQVNGVKMYARGFNVLPVDMTAGMPWEPERQRAVIELATHAHANLLRFNGVAPIAPRLMLDACDELGLLVWQELPLTSSSSDSLPPSLSEFKAVLDEGLPPFLRHLRSHPCVVVLDAGNELTDETRRPVTRQHPTVAYIEAQVRRAGLTQPFLPTSPSGPSYDLDESADPKDLHDVHGPWHYRGAVDSYRPARRQPRPVPLGIWLSGPGQGAHAAPLPARKPAVADGRQPARDRPSRRMVVDAPPRRGGLWPAD